MNPIYGFGHSFVPQDPSYGYGWGYGAVAPSSWDASTSDPAYGQESLFLAPSGSSGTLTTKFLNVSYSAFPSIQPKPLVIPDAGGYLINYILSPPGSSLIVLEDIDYRVVLVDMNNVRWPKDGSGCRSFHPSQMDRIRPETLSIGLVLRFYTPRLKPGIYEVQVRDYVRDTPVLTGFYIRAVRAQRALGTFRLRKLFPRYPAVGVRDTQYAKMNGEELI